MLGLVPCFGARVIWPGFLPTKIRPGQTIAQWDGWGLRRAADGPIFRRPVSLQLSLPRVASVSAIRGLREHANCNPKLAEERTAQRAPGTERLAPKNSAADHRFTKSVNSSSQQISAVGAQHSQRTKKKPPLSQAEPPSKMLGPSGEFVELRVSGVPRLRSDAPERPHTGTSCPSTSCGRD